MANPRIQPFGIAKVGSTANPLMAPSVAVGATEPDDPDAGPLEALAASDQPVTTAT